MKREKKQKKEVEPEVVVPPEEIDCGKCLHCSKPVMANNVNQGWVHPDCITKMEPTYPTSYTKKVKEVKKS